MLDFLGSILGSIGDGITGGLTALLQLLPESPFIKVYNTDQQWLKWINYFLPVAEYIEFLEAYTVAVALYYAIRIPLRWAKAAGE